MPLSSDPARRAAQLANLRPGAGAWKPGAAPALKHGGRTRAPERSPAFSEAKSAVVEQVERSVPIRGADGEVLPEFDLAVRMAAIQLVIVNRVAGWLQTHGWEDERGRLRLKEIEASERALARMRDWLRELAATPGSYSRAGLDVARTRREQDDLALRWSRELAAESDPGEDSGG